jgi:hypothetical protein
MQRTRRPPAHVQDALTCGLKNWIALLHFDASQQQLHAIDVKKCLVFLTTPFHNPTP